MLKLNIRQNIQLKNFTTWRIGGEAKYFVVVKTIDELKDAILEAKKNNWKYFILGGGSNILASDKGFDGLIIKIAIDELNISYNGNECIITAGAGALLAKIFFLAKQENLGGLEWAFGIPGTIGGAVYGNAGAYGKNIGLLALSVTVLLDDEVLEINNENCGFVYRGSIFKQNNAVILKVKLKLQKTDKQLLDNEIANIQNLRKGKHPLEPSAGSVFKNIQLKNYSTEFVSKIPSEKIKNGFVATAYLIEACNLKGKIEGNAKISEIHANYFVNIGEAKADDVLKLINTAKKAVKEKFGVDIDEEIIYLS